MNDVIERLMSAMNAHDAVAVAALFAGDYTSEQPLHPSRGFGGSAQVLENWTSVFVGVPDFHAELVAAAVQDDVAWTEMHWSGTHVDGTAFEMRGVTIVRVIDNAIAWARLYMEPVELAGTGIRNAVQELYHPPSE